MPVRLWLEVGLMETGRHAMLRCNRHFRDVLELKRYEVGYREFNGGHDYFCWRGGLAEGLIALTADWATNHAGPAIGTQGPNTADGP